MQLYSKAHQEWKESFCKAFEVAAGKINIKCHAFRYFVQLDAIYKFLLVWWCQVATVEVEVEKSYELGYTSL